MKNYKLKGVAIVACLVLAGSVAQFAESIEHQSDNGLLDVELAKEEMIFENDIALSSGGKTTNLKSGGGIAGTVNVSAPGVKTYEKDGSVIDASDIAKGYVIIRNSTSSKRLKVQIIKGSSTYNYDLKNGGINEIYPLQLGDGSYKVRVMENTSGNKYIPLLEQTIDVKLNNSLSPFLQPNQYVMYGSNWRIVAKANELTKGKKTEAEKIAAIYDYIIKNIKYDKHKANTVQPGYLPNIDETLTSGKGICFDYAALMSGMLRSQGIPTRLIVGTVSPNDINHAWNEVYLKDKGWVSVKIQFEGSTWNRMDSTFASSGNSGIESFIGNGSNYTGLRLY